QLGIVGLTALAAGMSLYLFSAALPLYLFRFRDYSLGQVGVLVGLTSVVQIIGTLGAGPLVDRRGARLAMRLGAACYVVAALLFLTSAWLPAIVLARVLHGIGIALLCVVYWGVITAFLPIEVPPDQVPNVGWFFAADALAVMAARIPTGYMADRFGARWLLVAGVATTGVAIGTLLISPSLATL